MAAGAPAVLLEGISKRYRLYHDRPHSLKERVVHRTRSNYDYLWALRDISLRIPEGSAFGLVGHNGSGKSTLLRLIAGIHRPTSGTVTKRGRLGALLELGAGFHPELTGRENIFLNGSIMGLTKKEIQTAFDDIVDFSGIEQFIDNPVKVYSSGMYVRLAFSVAVNLEPDLLLVDEIIAVGDEEFQRRCMEHIYSLKQRGCTIVLVSHSLPVVQTLCDRAAWLDHGRLMMEGAPVEVIDSYLEKVNEAERKRVAGEGSPLDEADEMRRGGGEVRITGLEFLDGSGHSSMIASTGAPLTIRIRYHATTPVEAPVFGLAIHHENGAHLAGPNTHFGGLEIGTVLADGFIDYRIERLPLMPGRYLLTAAIFDAAMLHPYDYRDKRFSLVVQPGSSAERYGLVELPGQWASPVTKDQSPRSDAASPIEAPGKTL